MSRRPRVLIVGDGGAPTGYARVLRAVFERLTGDFEVVHLATRYAGGPHDWPWELLAASDYGDVYGRTGLPGLVDELRPDLVFCLYDLAHQAAYVERIRAARHRARIVVYSPVESGPVEPELLPDVDRYVVFTPYARSLLPASLPVDVIPHGVDTEAFSPHDRDGARRRLGLGQLAQDDDSFVVLNANRNLEKKRLDTTIEAFALFASGKPAGVRLWLHTDTAGAFAVAPLIRRHRLAGRVVLTADHGGPPDLPTRQLRDVYCATDVGLSTTMNEGWGLVGLEHAACGRAQVLTATPNLVQLWRDAAVLVEPVARVLNPGLLTTSYVVSPQDVAVALAVLYDDPQYRARTAAAGLALARDPRLSWDIIAEQWRVVLHGAL